MYLGIFLADFVVFRVFGEFRGVSRKYLNFVGPQPCEISEALLIIMFIIIIIIINFLCLLGLGEKGN